jgi:hypothetical protein
MKNIFTRHRILFGILLIALIIAAEFTFHYNELPAWPAFLGMIFFFLGKRDVKLIAPILAGGLFGILCAFLIVPFKAAFGAPLGDAFNALVLFVAVFVMCIVLFKDSIPLLMNDYAFMLFLVSSIAFRAEKGFNPAGSPGEGHAPDFLMWMCVALIGGGVLIAGVIGISRLADRLAGEG